MEKIIIQQSKGKLIKLLIAALVMTAVGITMLYIVIENYSEEGYQSSKLLRYKNTSLVFSIIGVLFFGSATILCISDLFKSTPLIIITDCGITFHFGLTRNMKTFWENIKVVNELTMNGQKLIGVELNNDEKFVAKQNFITNKIIKLNRLIGVESLNFSLSSTKEKPEEVVAIMNKYLSEWRKNNEQEEN